MDEREVYRTVVMIMYAVNILIIPTVIYITLHLIKVHSDLDFMGYHQVSLSTPILSFRQPHAISHLVCVIIIFSGIGLTLSGLWGSHYNYILGVLRTLSGFAGVMCVKIWVKYNAPVEVDDKRLQSSQDG
jgi:hypothetical protein